MLECIDSAYQLMFKQLFFFFLNGDFKDKSRDNSQMVNHLYQRTQKSDNDQ